MTKIFIRIHGTRALVIGLAVLSAMIAGGFFDGPG
jgi:hypothetical protein